MAADGYVPVSTGSLREIQRTYDLLVDPPRRAQVFVRVLGHRRTGQVHDFCLVLYVEDATGRHEVERVDCCHSQLHRHVFRRGGDERRKVIRELYPGDEVYLGDEFQREYEDMIDQWADRYRRWCR